MSFCYHPVAMLDHLVYGTPELPQAVDELEVKLGVRAAPGGKHAGGLTHNALLSLGEGSYLEIIAPAPGVVGSVAALPFGLATLTSPRLVAWAVAVDDLEGRVKSARAAGYDPGDVITGGRELPDGGTLSWRLAVRPQTAGNGLVPFLIEWTSQPHPSRTAPAGCRLVSLRAEHPEPEGIRQMLGALSVDLPVEDGPAPRLIAALETPKGRVELS